MISRLGGQVNKTIFETFYMKQKCSSVLVLEGGGVYYFTLQFTLVFYVHILIYYIWLYLGAWCGDVVGRGPSIIRRCVTSTRMGDHPGF